MNNKPGAIFLDKGIYVASKFICEHVLGDPEFSANLFMKFVAPTHYGTFSLFTFLLY
jgi:hypothetical protein